MAQAATSVTDEESWEFDLGEHVTLLWSGKSGQVIGRTEFIHRDVKYLVQFVNDDEKIVETWVYDEAIDHLPARH